MTLLVAATQRELCGHPGLVCGVGPVEAATATARALALDRPGAVLHVGVAGGTGLEPGTLVVGTESVYVDISAAIPVVSRVEPDPALLATVLLTLPEAVAVPIETSARVRPRGSEPRGSLVPRTVSARESERRRNSEPRGVRVQAMEGFGVLRAGALAGVPALEVRAISNELGEEDRERWEIPRALDALAGALPRLLAAVPK